MIRGKWKKMLSFVVTLAMTTTIMPVNDLTSVFAAEPYVIASGIDGNLTWEISGDGLLTISGEGDYASSVPEWIHYPDDITRAVVDVQGITSTANMFNSCANMRSVDLTKLDTAQVTDMSGMFMCCSALTDLDVSGFDTANVTSFYDMFGLCASLSNLDVSGFDTSNAVNMTDMFIGCSGLTELDVSHFNTSNVTTMTGMFSDCTALSKLDVSGFDTSNVTNMINMFSNCCNVTELDVSHFDTSNVEEIGQMFSGCVSVQLLDVSGFDTSNVIGMSGMFSDCTSLSKLDVSGFDTSNVIDMSGMFKGCTSLSELDVSSFDTSNVTRMYGMFRYCSGLQDLNLSGFNTAKVVEMDAMFQGCSNLKNLNLSSFDTTKVVEFSYMFASCEKLSTRIWITSEEIMSNQGMFEGAATDENAEIIVDYGGRQNAEYIQYLIDTKSENSHVYLGERKELDPDKIRASGVEGNLSWVLTYGGDLTITGEGDYDVDPEKDAPEWTRFRWDIHRVVVDVKGLTSTRNMFKFCEFDSIEFINFDTSKVTNMSGMFEDSPKVEHLDVSGFDTSNVTDMSRMFAGCQSVTSLDVTSFDTSNVTDMSGMFSGCQSVTSLDVTSFDTSNVTNMSGMFAGCANMTNLNMSSFDTANVTDMSNMFGSCEAIESIDLSNFDTSNVTNMSELFGLCYHLTEVNLEKFDTSKVTDMSNMFDGCWRVTKWNLSSFDTSNVTNMSGMFGGTAVTGAEFGNFDTSKVTDMSFMFYDNRSSEFNLCKLDTSNVTNMRYLFASSDRLKKVDLSNLDTSKVDDCRKMFANCSNLSGRINISSNVTSYEDMFYEAATADDAEIYVDYTGNCSKELAQLMVDTKSENSHVYLGKKDGGEDAPEGIIVDENQKTVTVTGYEGEETELTIPEEINGKEVTSISENAFENNETLQSVIIPETVEVIGDNAFRGCENLTSVTFEEEVVGKARTMATFAEESDNVVLSSHLTTIGNYAFYNCINLHEVKIPASVTSIGEKAFGYADPDTKVKPFIISTYSGTAAQEYAKKNQIDVNLLDDLKHEWDAGTIIKVPSCCEEGVIEYKCSCGSETITESLGYDASNHVGGTEIRNQKEATCKEAGYTGDTYCKGCGEKIASGKTIPATGKHIWGTGIVIKKATCAEPGAKKYECKCGDTKIEATPKDPSNHVGGTVVKNDKEPTCAAEGYTGDVFCKGCNAKLSSGKTIAKTNDHNWDAGVVTKEPTEKEDGIRTFTCSVCKETKTETIPVLGHTHVYDKEIVIKEPTCVEPGEKTISCVCGEVLKTEVIPATGMHNYVDHVCTICGKREMLSAPVIKSVTNGLKGVVVQWEAVEDADNYRIYRKKAGATTWSRVGDTTELRFDDTTAVSGTTYFYTVRPYDLSIMKPTGDYDKEGKSILYLKAGTPSSLTNATSGITVKWNKIAGANGYYVYRKSGTDGYKKIANVKGGANICYTDTSVKNNNGVVYTYTIRAYSGDTLGNYAGKSITRLTGVVLSKLSNTAKGVMKVTWKKQSKATGYEIQYSTSSTFAKNNKSVKVKGASTLSTVIKGLTKGKTYYVRIRGYKTAGSRTDYSAWSAKKSLKLKK